MSWNKFDGHARTRDETLKRITELKWTDWKPEGITLHNTAEPTLAKWVETGVKHDQRIANLQDYYEDDLGWHAGPHFFVSRNWINWFSNPLLPGVHSRCWNSTRFGIEMVGDFDKEQFDTGDGKMVRDNAVFLIAALNIKFGFDPSDLVFHRECKKDNHACPGRLVQKPAVISLVREEMIRLKTPIGQTTPTPKPEPQNTTSPPPAPSTPVTSTRPPIFEVQGKMSTFGGPDDTGMKLDEGLAIFNTATEMQAHGLGDWLHSAGRTGGLGIGRRLKVDKPYLACRWDYGITSKRFLQDASIEVSNPKTGKVVQARAVDWGPNARTGRVADLSPGLAKELGLDTDDVVRVRVFG